MELAIFAKKRTTKEGKAFYTYLTQLVRKSTGEILTSQVKFREDCGSPKSEKCPCYINVEKGNANFVEKKESIETENGETKEITSRTVWVSAWSYGREYVDNSMDDFA